MLSSIYSDRRQLIHNTIPPQTTRTTEGVGVGTAAAATTIVSPHFILSISGMLFSIEALGRALPRVGHALRALVERETRGRRDRWLVLEEEGGGGDDGDDEDGVGLGEEEDA